MNDKKTLGPYIKAKDLKNLPEDRRVKYHEEQLEAKIDCLQASLFEMFSGGRENYSDILGKFNEASEEGEEIRTPLLENKKIIEIMEVVLHVLACERYLFVGEIKEVNKGIETVFKSDFGKDPWKGKLLAGIGNNAIYTDEVKSLVAFFKGLSVPEEEYKTALDSALKITESQSVSASIASLKIRKDHGMKIEAEMLKNLKQLGDQSLKHLDFARASKIYEALIEVGHNIGEERSSVVSVYNSGRDKSQKTELMTNIGINAGIIPKPKEPERAIVNEISEKGDAEEAEKKPWWRFW